MKITSKVITSLALCLFSVAFVSCGKSSKQEKQQANGSLSDLNLPDWVLSPSVAGKIAGTGIAPMSKGGLKVQIAQAETDARANIAAQISTEISRITKDAMKKANISDKEEYEASFSQATKELIKDLPLSGAVRDKIYRDPSDGGTLYVHMVVDQEKIKDYLQNSTKIFGDAMKSSGATSKTIQETEKVMSSLFNELDVERGKKTVEQVSVEEKKPN